MAQEAAVPHGRKPPPASGDDHDGYSSNGESPGDLAAIRAAAQAWRTGPVASSVAKIPLRRARFSTWSDLDVADVLTPADVHPRYLSDLGLPGEYPFTRG